MYMLQDALNIYKIRFIVLFEEVMPAESRVTPLLFHRVCTRIFEIENLFTTAPHEPNKKKKCRHKLQTYKILRNLDLLKYIRFSFSIQSFI